MQPRPSEDDLIARYFAPLAGEGGLHLADDAALFRPRAGHEIVLTVDAVVAGVHFFPDDPPDAIAAKALGVNLSDLAAKGAEPAGFLLTLVLPRDWTESWLAQFCAGLGEAAREGGCPLLGGDTVQAGGPLSLSITALGEVPEGRMVRRTSAKPGDVICVTGTIGDAALGLAVQREPVPPWAASLSGEARSFLVERYRRPQPRLALAPGLRDFASAAMDVSDGLAGDLAKMMRGAGLTAVIERDAIPHSDAVAAALRLAPELDDLIVTGGDDYEILCTVSDTNLPALREAAQRVGIRVTPIGRTEPGQGLPRFQGRGGERRYRRGSFAHF